MTLVELHAMKRTLDSNNIPIEGRFVRMTLTEYDLLVEDMEEEYKTLGEEDTAFLGFTIELIGD